MGQLCDSHAIPSEEAAGGVVNAVRQCCLVLHSPLPSPKSRSAALLILRGANDFMVDEMERSVHDALCVVKRVLESHLVVPGGGAVETALSVYLENFARTLVGGAGGWVEGGWEVCVHSDVYHI